MTDHEFIVLSRAIFLHENGGFCFGDVDEFWEQEKESFHFSNGKFTKAFIDLCDKDYIVDIEDGSHVGEWSVSQKGLVAHSNEDLRRSEEIGEKQLDRSVKEASITAPRKANQIALAALIVAIIGTILAFFALVQEKQKVNLDNYVKKDELQKMINDAQIEILDIVYSDTSIVKKG